MRRICTWLLVVICLIGVIATTGCRTFEKKQDKPQTVGEFLRQPRASDARKPSIPPIPATEQEPQSQPQDGEAAK